MLGWQGGPWMGRQGSSKGKGGRGWGVEGLYCSPALITQAGRAHPLSSQQEGTDVALHHLILPLAQGSPPPQLSPYTSTNYRANKHKFLCLHSQAQNNSARYTVIIYDGVNLEILSATISPPWSTSSLAPNTHTRRKFLYYSLTSETPNMIYSDGHMTMLLARM